MWTGDWRNQVWSQLDTKFDIIIIGGGITGAGILREASRLGYKALLVEAKDFASGTSSRSSKLVHGGLRYLKNLQFKTTMDSVREREELLRHGKGLINHLEILFASYQRDRMPAWQMCCGMMLYGALAGKWQKTPYTAASAKQKMPYLNTNQFVAGFPYYDAQTDDARLTIRVLQEAVMSGGIALNYARASALLRNQHHQVCGIDLTDQTPAKLPRTAEITSDLVINATGAWADELRSSLGLNKKIRPLRGSHITFGQDRLPLPFSVSINHPTDGRPVFAFPWEGITLVGTTDIDIKSPIDQEPYISQPEAEYLLEFVRFAFPELDLTFEDVISSWSGIRPVIDTGKENPSKESRDHAIWYENGLLTITGGKLTTFRVMAQDVMSIAKRYLPEKTIRLAGSPVLLRIPTKLEEIDTQLPLNFLCRLLGRYVNLPPEQFTNLTSDDIFPIEYTPYIWKEIEWCAKHEGIIHLDDLLLRRVRLGILLPHGGRKYLPKIKQLTQNILGWDDTRWKQEVINYTKIIEKAYSL